MFLIVCLNVDAKNYRDVCIPVTYFNSNGVNLLVGLISRLY